MNRFETTVATSLLTVSALGFTACSLEFPGSSHPTTQTESLPRGYKQYFTPDVDTQGTFEIGPDNAATIKVVSKTGNRDELIFSDLTCGTNIDMKNFLSGTLNTIHNGRTHEEGTFLVPPATLPYCHNGDFLPTTDPEHIVAIVLLATPILQPRPNPTA